MTSVRHRAPGTTPGDRSAIASGTTAGPTDGSASARGGGRRSAAALVAGALAVATLTACTDSRPTPDATAEALAQGLESLDLSDVPLAGATSADATEQVAAVVAGLDPWRPEVEVSSVRTDEEEGTTATADLEISWDVDASDTDWTYTVQAPMEYVEPDGGDSASGGGDGGEADEAARWRVRWSPELIAPGLVEGEALTAERVRPERGPVLGQAGTEIVVDRSVLRLGVDKTVATDAAAQDAAARALATLTGVDVEAFAGRVAAAGPRAFVEAIVVREEDPAGVDVEAARAIPGVTVVADVLPLAPTRRFARAVLGTVGEATAEIVAESDGAVVAGDLAGLSGLQARYDEQLRGRPGLTIRSTGATGGGTRDLFRSEPVPGQPLQTTLDPRLQDLAETTLEPVVPASAIVAVRPSTGEVLAAASGPGSAGLSTATVGRYPPGSTFKVATALGLLRAGLTPDSTLACPPTVTADGRQFQNFPGYPTAALGDVPLRTAFAHSCNTAMIGARDTVTQAALADAAGSLGLGQPDDVGFAAFLGSVPSEAGGTAHAASMIGQAQVEASPLAMAVVAASVGSGRTVRPVLVVDDEHVLGAAAAVPTPLDPAEAATLTGLMRAVVTDGSGDFLADLPGEPVGAKSGTAQFGTEDPPRNHAWMIAVQGDLAVSVFVEEGDFGSTTAGPLLEAFLRGAAG